MIVAGLKPSFLTKSTGDKIPFAQIDRPGTKSPLLKFTDPGQNPLSSNWQTWAHNDPKDVWLMISWENSCLSAWHYSVFVDLTLMMYCWCMPFCCVLGDGAGFGPHASPISRARGEMPASTQVSVLRCCQDVALLCL